MDTYYLNKLAVHFAGNKSQDETLILSKKETKIDAEINPLLTKYFLSGFKTEEYFHFFHDTDLKYNEVFSFVSEIFEDPETLFENSVNLAKHLYEKSLHPKIKSGEFYVVYFEDYQMGEYSSDAIGLFKTENKDVFLKVKHTEDQLLLESEKGISLNKPDKACLIFNVEKENGFIVSVIDNTNKNIEAQYWIDEFLKVKQRHDKYYNTQNLLALTKTFVTNELPEHFAIEKADQVDLLNRSVKFFKEKEEFDFEEFSNEVIGQPEVIESFNRFKEEYQKEHDIEIADNFNISASAVKKQARIFKSVIKLDKNFHIYIHGNREMIESGTDEVGRKFYKIYYEVEN